MYSCSFCNEISKIDDNNLFKKIFKDEEIENRIILETDNFVVLPTIGAFVKGYLLIVTKKHYTSMAQISKEELNELNCVIKTCKNLISDKLDKKSILFEHGSIPACRASGACVDHAHLHIVPSNINIDNNLKKYDVNICKIENLKYLTEKFANYPYLYYQNIYNEEYLVKSDCVPSQFFRQVLCSAFDMLEHWDWRKNYEVDNIKETLKIFKKSDFMSEFNKIKRG